MKSRLARFPRKREYHGTVWCVTVFVILIMGAVASSAQTLTTLYSFTGGTDGANPNAPLVQGTDGNFYGTNWNGGTSCTQSSSGCGTIFQITPQGALSTLQSFGNDGSNASALIQATDGKFYGTAGAFFSIIPGGSLVIVNGALGSNAPIMQATDGNFYGSTEGGGLHGSIFSVTSAGALTTLHSFPGCGIGASQCDGYDPIGGVVQGGDGIFYGTTASGGNENLDVCEFGNGGEPHYCGVVFKITASGSYTVLYQLCPVQGSCPEGWQPGRLIQGTDGNFYGATAYSAVGTTCGAIEFNPCGSIFKVTPQGVLTVLHTFTYTDGGGANTLVQATDGNFYGTTVGGGANGVGTVFRMTPDGSLLTLYNFSGPDGSVPNAVIQAANGIFYGTTKEGGAHGAGTVFSFSIGLGGTAPSTTGLTLSPSEVTVGSAGPIVMTATVVPASGSGTPTGGVAFYMGSTQLGLSTLTNGVAILDYNSSALAVNIYEFTASYVGDSTYAASTSSAQALTVSSLPQAATPTFSPAAGNYNSAQTVTLSDATSGATLYYTNDGTTPTTSSAVYNGPITINSTETLKVIAAAGGYADSAVASATYTITLNPDYQVSVNPATLSIVAGQSGTATFTVTPMNGFNSQVSFACSGLPAGVTCSFSPPSVTPNGAPITSKLTVSTMAPSAVVLGPSPDSRLLVYAMFLCGLEAMFILVSQRKSAGRRLAAVPIAALLIMTVLLPSCGSNSNPGGGNGGTPVGTSTVTASASTSGSGAVSHTATLTITITH